MYFIFMWGLFSRSAHEAAHRKADERGNKLRWPWEKLLNSGVDESVDPAAVDGSLDTAENR